MAFEEQKFIFLKFSLYVFCVSGVLHVYIFKFVHMCKYACIGWMSMSSSIVLFLLHVCVLPDHMHVVLGNLKPDPHVWATNILLTKALSQCLLLWFLIFYGAYFGQICCIWRMDICKFTSPLWLLFLSESFSFVLYLLSDYFKSLTKMLI